MRLEQAYRDHWSLVLRQANRFHRRHGGNREDILSRCNLAFVEACLSHQEEKGTLKRRVAQVIWYSLLREAQRPREAGGVDMDAIPAQERHNPLEGIGEDADLVIRTILEVPGEILETLGRRARPEYRRRKLAQMFQEMGWTVGRITQAFTEITEALG